MLTVKSNRRIFKDALETAEAIASTAAAPSVAIVSALRNVSTMRTGAALLALVMAGLAMAAVPPPFDCAPPEWQTLICLPEDDHKSLVDHQGTLLYDHGKGGGEFATRISLAPCVSNIWQSQELLDPRVPIVRTFSKAGSLECVSEAFALRGTELIEMSAMVDAQSHLLATQRLDAILLTMHNTGRQRFNFQPQATIFTVFGLKRAGEELHLGNGATVLLSHEISGEITRKRGYHRVPLRPITLEPGASTTLALLYTDGAHTPTNVKVEALQQARDQMEAFWRAAPLPYGRVEVPDQTMQALLDSSIRNIWQCREAHKGETQFQPGSTCYRGLWIVDGAFMAETATLLGRVEEARATLRRMLAHQQPDGGIRLMPDFSKENGITLWAFCQHARLTADKAWLQAHWPQLERIARYIQNLRRATLTNDEPLDDGLMPAGMPDGGQAQVLPEYSNVLWNIAGLQALTTAALWLGDDACAVRWQSEVTAFKEALQRAAARDLRVDRHGHRYLPNYMGAAATNDLPQRGLWSFCLAIHPGKVFARDDPLVQGTLAMLRGTEKQGMVVGTGWHESGIWSYFASFYAHAWLWQGQARKATDLLHAFAGHAAPTLVWCEEHSLKGARHKKIGDMPHAWAGAEFLRLTIHLLAFERDTELHLFEGLPACWTKPGMITALKGIATSFGPLTCTLTISEDGRQAHLALDSLSGAACSEIVVRTHAWGGDEPLRLVPHQDHRMTLPINISADRQD